MREATCLQKVYVLAWRDDGTRAGRPGSTSYWRIHSTAIGHGGQPDWGPAIFYLRNRDAKEVAVFEADLTDKTLRIVAAVKEEQGDGDHRGDS